MENWKLTACSERPTLVRERVFKSRRLDRSQNGSSRSIKDNNQKNSASSRSVREKSDKVSSRSSKSSRRDSDSSSKRSGNHRSDRDKKADAKERDHHRSSRSIGKHHKTNSDRHEKLEKNRKWDILEPAKSSDI
jgi:hypothetical protein